uniref:NADH dehydrogenase subunit 6 n=1 Tax=Leptopalpus rostratus TaxID=2914704 RepID=UPI001FA72BC9|nr:NADH dehydrogenase subunit 6 [Leptopalpus rostratus]UMR54896.1 NADH dehydrogenase subunit 6 [Leptopalpus rostratus]
MIMITLNILFSMIFLMLTHPLSLGMILLVQTTIISLMSGTFSYNFWFSYILFLVMIGGMLILFIYMTSIASNEKFSFIMKPMWLTMFMLMILIPASTLFSADLIISNSMTNNNITETTISMIKYTYIPMNMILMFMIMYLFMTMIAIVKIIEKNSGPLRQKN